MDFAISGVHIHPFYLIATGFIIGVLGGFFGVGGSFLAGPVLFFAGVPMNFVVGTDLTHIVGKSIVAARKHHMLGNVDMKLGLIMVIGTIPGVEIGARIIQRLKQNENVNTVVGIAFVIVLVCISTFTAWEAWKTYRLRQGRSASKNIKKDESAIAHFAKRVQRVQLPPMIKLPASDVSHISFWVILGTSFVGGVLSGFLGGGAGYIRMPSLVYILGVPTHIAVGTDLFEVVVSASYGTITHAIKGNVDIMIALVMHTGAAIGAQIGARLTEHFHGSRIRMAFVPLPLIGAALIIYSLVSGHHFK